MRKSVNRRTVLKTAAASFVATSVAVPVLASEPNPDAELIALHADWVASGIVACDARNHAHVVSQTDQDITPAFEAEDIAWKQYFKLYKEIEMAPALSIHGIMVKLEAWAELNKEAPGIEDSSVIFITRTLQDAKRLSAQQGGVHV